MKADALRIETASDADESAWDDYVRRAPAGTFFHLYGWKTVAARAYGRGALFLMAVRGARTVGVLPLIDVNSPLFGRNLISTGYTVGGGLVADDDEAKLALAARAEEEGRIRRAGYVELRSEQALIGGWPVKRDVYAGFARALPGSEEELLRSIPRRRRAEVRKSLDALSAGKLSYAFGDAADTFYRLYARALRDLGTPVFPRRFLAALLETFAEAIDILTIRADGEPVLSLLSFRFRDRVMPYYFGASPEARSARAFDLATFLRMRAAIEEGARLYDFGRSKYGSGSFDYKTYWGFEPAPLEYQYALLGARELPNVNPNNPKFALATRVWRKLPVPVATMAGPLLARELA